MAEDGQDTELLTLLPKLKILATDNSLGGKLDLKPLLSIAEDIVINTTGTSVPSHSDDVHVQRDSKPIAEIAKVLEYPINYTSYVMTYWNYAGGEDPNSLTMELLKLLSNYSWDAKVVIVYTAFAINYGEFWLLHQLHHEPKHELADSIAKLMRFPNGTLLGCLQLEVELKAVIDVLTAGLKLTHCIIEFRDIISTNNISRQLLELIATTVYWIIRSLVDCASTLTNLFADFNGEKLLGLAHKLSAMLRPLQKQLKIFKERVEDDNKYNVLESSLESSNTDNMKVLRALIRFREYEKPLYNGAKRENEPIEALRQKHVLLLISDLQFSKQELHILRNINNMPSTRHDYEILWFPIVDRTTSWSPVEELDFYCLRSDMPWYSVDHPTMVERPAIRYIRDHLHFMDKPMLVVLDPHGKLSHHDALPMMWIWGADAFPFTKDREIQLWSSTSDDCNIDLLADNIDPRIPEWVRENKFICLYGGNNVDWIRNFTQSAREVASAVNIPLEMLYAGALISTDEIGDCLKVIDREKLSHILGNVDSYGYHWFWMRLSNMWASKKRINGWRTMEGDKILQGILDVLALDGSLEGWALFSRANNEITMASGLRLQPVLGEYTRWANEVDHPDKFVNVLDKKLRGFQPGEHTTRLIVGVDSGYIPDRLVCNECGKTMEMYVMFRCCLTD